MAWRNEKDIGAEAICDVCGALFTIEFDENSRNSLLSAHFFVNPCLGDSEDDVIDIEHVCLDCRKELKAAVESKIAYLKKAI